MAHARRRSGDRHTKIRLRTWVSKEQLREIDARRGTLSREEYVRRAALGDLGGNPGGTAVEQLTLFTQGVPEVTPDWLLRAWNTAASRWGLTVCLGLDGSLERAARGRLREHPERAWWERAIAALEAAAQRWRRPRNLDWFLRPRSARHLVERDGGKRWERPPAAPTAADREAAAQALRDLRERHGWGGGGGG